MSFYGGRPGKSFSIDKVFKNYKELYDEMQQSNTPEASLELMDVLVDSFVAILYGSENDKAVDDNFFAENPTLKPNLENFHATVWMKRYYENEYRYTHVAELAGIIPEISNTTGTWTIGGEDTGIKAIGRQIEFQLEYDRQEGYTLLSKVIDGEIIYGLTNANKKYSFNALANTYDADPNGEFVFIDAATSEGTLIYENGLRKEIGYEKYTDWQVIDKEDVTSVFTTDWLQWRFIDSFDKDGNKIWEDLFEITDLISVRDFKNEVLNATQQVKDYYFEIESTKTEIDKTSDKLSGDLNTAAGYKDEALKANASMQKILDEFKSISEENANEALLAEIKASREDFDFLPDRLNLMPYQFNTISEMQKNTNLKADDKVFTFGRDNIGDGDQSKLFQVFEANDNKLSETDSEGELIIKEQYPLANGLIAGLLTIFSGYGSGGGGGTAVPSLTVTGEEFTLQENETVTLEYYWTGPTAGIATLFITDSNKTSPKVVDYYDPSKVYSSGVKIPGFGAGSVTLQPSKGEHNYTIYIVDRAQSFSNEVKVKVTVGGVSLSVNYPDGKSFASNQAITYNYTVNTIYAKPSILKYKIYQSDVLFKEGEITSTSSQAGSQLIPLQIKSSIQNIGQGEFRIVAFAHVEGDESVATPSITRSFVIMESGVIYLTTAYDGDMTPQEQDTAFQIPFELIYNGGSNFSVEGRYSKDKDFDWTNNWDQAEIIPPGVFPAPPAAGPFNYNVIFPEIGTYYLKFVATSAVDKNIRGESRIVKVNIVEKTSIYQLQSEDFLQVYYSAEKGQSNNDPNKGKWKNLSKVISGYDAILKGFNFLSNGWETVRQGGVDIPTGYLHCNSKAYVTTDYPFFENLTETTGGTVELVFKSVNIGKDQTIFSMTYATGAGLFIYKDKIVLNMPTWGISNLTAYYNINGIQETDKPVHVAVTIDPIKRYAKIYVNGVLCRASAELNYSAIRNETTTYINRGLSDIDPQFGIVKVDALRFYNTDLTSVQVLRNYVYDLRDDKEQAAVYSKNFLDSDSEDTIPEEIPYMTFYLTRDQWETMTKDEKKAITITYHDPNPAEGNETDYKWEKVKTSWQGTSSIAYPVKNFKFKLPEKYYLKGKDKSLGEKTFCLKADYMDSSHCHNTGNTNFIHQTGLLSNYSLTPAQSKELNIPIAQGYKGLPEDIKPENLKTRTTIDGYPIALYICLQSEEQNEATEGIEYDAPIFWGIYNFNLDKGSTDSFGLRRDEDDFQNVTSFEIAANSAYDGGGFRAMRFVKKIDSEEYGWTKWNVTYKEGNEVDMSNGKLLLINKALKDGSIIEITRKINFTENEINYIGGYNKNKDIKGIYAPSLRYTESGEQSAQGEYIELFKLDDEADTFAYETVDGVSNKIVLGYYKYLESEWSKDVPKDSVELSEKTLWQVIENPENQDFKYDYYEADFELRFPDADLYLTKDNKMNKLYYKEYDKLISLVEWVDNINSDFNFKEEFSSHFDTNTLMNYYLMLMTVGLIDNFGKNLMIDTWGYDKDGNIPFDVTQEGYHKVWKFISEWNEDEEYYEDSGAYQYGLMDLTDSIVNEENITLYKVYETDKNYSSKGNDLGYFEFGETTDDRITGWYHETDTSKYIWYTHFYDLDSCLGVNNSGILSFSPSIEMMDNFYINYEEKEVLNAPFNTSNSALWKQFVENFNLELKNRYLELTSDKRIFDIKTFNKYYNTDIIKSMGERMYNNDAYPKYLSREPIKVVVAGQPMLRYPYSFDHLALGNDWNRISSWLNKRITYLTTMFKQNDDDNDGGFELRIEKPTNEYHIQIECYDPMYMRIISKNRKSDFRRIVSTNGSTTFVIPPGGATDQEVYILPGNNVKSFKEVSPVQLGFSSAKLDTAPNLLELNLVNSEGLTDISYEQEGQSLLRSYNVENCPNLTAVINSTKYPYLEYVNTLGTQAIFNFNPNGGIIEEAHLEAASNQTSLIVENYADLKLLELQLSYQEPPNGESDQALTHNAANISQLSFINCSRDDFNFKLKGRYKDKVTGKYTGTVDLNPFITKFGKLSLFPRLTSVTLRNTSIDESKIEKQLQPDGTIKSVRELKLALPVLEKLEVISPDSNKIKYDKIAFIETSRLIDGKTKYVGFPGWGLTPEVTLDSDNNKIYTGDTNLATNIIEGIFGDKYIKELEFRAPYLETSYPESTLPPVGTKFEFPWRTYLGNLPGLERLKFNTKKIYPKLITSKDDKYYLTRPDGNTAESWLPNRFELILPSPIQESSLNLIYFAPGAEEIQFTCIRQKDTNKGEYIVEKGTEDINYPVNWPDAAKGYFESILTGSGDNELGKTLFHAFKGIDLRDYQNLAINFQGLTKIKGILGMNTLGVSEIGNNFDSKEKEGKAFSNYFNNCNAIESFFIVEKTNEATQNTPAIYKYEDWDFSPWFNNYQYSKYFKDISGFFRNCFNLKDTYLKGLLNQTTQSFSIQKANSLFENCKGLTKIKLNWVDNDCLSNVERMFYGCLSLQDAEIKIENLKLNKNLTSLKQLFSGCEKLISPKVFLIAENGTPYFKYIQNVEEMFSNCKNLTILDLSINLPTSNYPAYDFNDLINGSKWFQGCGNLKSVKFIDNANFTHLESFDSAFAGCEKLASVFDNPIGGKPVFYNGTEENKKIILSLSKMFNGCLALGSIGALNYADFTRVNDISSIFYGCLALGTDSSWHENNNLNINSNTFDLSNIIFFNSVNATSAFQNCQQIQSIIFPNLKVSNIASMFDGCKNLSTLNLNNIETDEGITKFNRVFAGCINLSNLDGYQNWKVNEADNLQALFFDCKKLTSIDLSNWKILSTKSKTFTLEQMFQNCSELINIVGLNNLFGTVRDVYYGSIGKYNPAKFIATGVQELFSGCGKLNFDEINLSAWARMVTDITSVKGMFYKCSKLTDLNRVLANINLNGDFSELWWGHKDNNDTYSFSKLTNFEQMCQGTSITAFDYFSTDHNVGYSSQESSDKFIKNIRYIVGDCNKLTAFKFSPFGAKMQRLFSFGSTVFSGCPKLSIITFPLASPDGNLGIKVNIDLTNIMNQSEPENTLDFIGNTSFSKYIYNFNANNEKPDNDLYGVIKLTSDQLEALTRLNQNEVEAISMKGWIIGAGN